MQLTPERKAHIDALSYEQLLSRWRFAPIGDPWFQDETGDYWGKRLAQLRAEPGGNDRHVTASKKLDGTHETHEPQTQNKLKRLK